MRQLDGVWLTVSSCNFDSSLPDGQCLSTVFVHKFAGMAVHRPDKTRQIAPKEYNKVMRDNLLHRRQYIWLHGRGMMLRVDLPTP